MATVLSSTASKLSVSYRDALTNRYSPAELAVLAAADTKPLFFYGSLMLPIIVARVLGSRQLVTQLASQMTPAILYDHERLAVHFVDFPAVLPVPASASSNSAPKVDGMLVFGLTAEQRFEVQYFEAGLYDLKAAEVQVEAVESLEVDGVWIEKKVMVKVAAEVYIWSGRRNELYDVSEKEWCIEDFMLSTFGSVLLCEGY